MHTCEKELASDLRYAHRKDAIWARELLVFLSGPSGFLRMVMFAIDTDFVAVAVHKLVRLQDQPAPDVSTAMTEVQHCVDTCRVLFVAWLMPNNRSLAQKMSNLPRNQ
jgi:hypothetical protein